jgi:predicted nucleic acid-binding protein
MRYIVDTSVLIDHLRGQRAATELLVKLVRRRHELWSVTLVRTEIIAGMRPAEAEPTHALLARLRWLDVTIPLADLAGTLASRFLRSHPGVDVADYVIAAGTQALGARLLTRNVKHFPMFPKLRAAY